MKKYILLLFLTILLIANLAGADRLETVEIRGVIGDYAPESRVYEVDGRIYQFEEGITIQTQAGELLSFNDLKGGISIKIMGEQESGPGSKEKVKYFRIIVMKEKEKPK